MTCVRCNGLMVSEQIYDVQGTNGELYGEGYRCLLCGNLVDTVILENRRRLTVSVESILLTSPRMPRPVAV